MEKQKLVFYVPDRASLVRSKAELKSFKMPERPSIEAISEGRSVAKTIAAWFRREPVKIKVSVSKNNEEIVRHNRQLYEYELQEREQIRILIEKCIDPALGTIESHDHDIEYLFVRLDNIEKTLKQVVLLLNANTDANIDIPPIVFSRNPWRGTIKHAALLVIEEYNKDLTRDLHEYRSLKDACGEFYQSHSFVQRPRMTEDEFYANVRKAKEWMTPN
jgi:hypothetical protein